MDSLTPEQWIIIYVLIGIPLLAVLIVLIAWIGKNAGTWAQNLYGWIRARIVGIIIVIFGLMAVAGILLLYFWTENPVFMMLSIPLLVIILFTAMFYLLAPRPKVLLRA